MTGESDLEKKILELYLSIIYTNNIAFVREGVIYTVTPDGRNEREIAEGFNPKWNPVGDKIAYQKVQNGRIMLCTVSLDNRTQKILDSQAGVSSDHKRWVALEKPMPYPVFEWSPDGKEIAYVSNGLFGSRLKLVSQDGSYRNNLVNRNIRDIVWSPDGRHIAYMESIFIYVLDTKTKKRENIMRLRDVIEGKCMAWPKPDTICYLDGDRVYYIKPDGEYHFAGKFCLFDELEEDPRDLILASGAGYIYSSQGRMYVKGVLVQGECGSFSPDGKKIVYQNNYRGDSWIYIQEIGKNKKPERLAKGHSPAWGPM